MSECTHVKNADGQEKSTGERDAFLAIEKPSKNGELKTLINTVNKNVDTKNDLGQKEMSNSMNADVEQDRQNVTQKCNNAEENGLFLVTSQEINSLLYSRKAGETVNIAEMESMGDLHRLTQEDLTTLFPAQKAANTQSVILSSVAALAMLKNLTEKSIRACNSHDELVTIAKELIKILDRSDVPAVEYMHLARKMEVLFK